MYENLRLEKIIICLNNSHYRIEKRKTKKVIMLITKFFTHIHRYGFTTTFAKTIDYLKNLIQLKITTYNLRFKKIFTGEPLIVKHGKYKFPFYNDGDFDELLYHAHWNKYYEYEKEKIKSFVKKGSAVIDVGGNLGFYTIILSELVGENGKVYTFEPSPECYKKLNKSVSINNLENVEIVNLGLGEEEKKAELFYNPDQTGLSSIVRQVSDNTVSEEIRITTLDRLLDKIHLDISLIKIDTEGYEPHVLAGGRKLLAVQKPVICIELGGKYINTSLKALEILREFNYESEAFNVDLTQIPQGTNFIAVPGA